MIYNFDQIIDRRKSDSAKWGHFDADVLPMWVADMDFLSPEPVIRALRERVDEGVFGYAFDSASLKEAIVVWLEARFNWQVKPEDIMPLSGVVSGFNLITQALVGPGEGVLYQPPVYMPFLQAAKHAGGHSVESELVLNPDGRYTIDFDAFDQAAYQPGREFLTRMFLLCSPHNPVGRVWQRDELEKMAEICLRKGVYICSDEIHADLVYSDARHIPIASLSPEIAQKTVTLMAPSKTFNIPGLGFAFAVIQNADIRRKVETATRGVIPHPNLLGMTAANAAYREGAEWLDQALMYLKGNRDLLTEKIRGELPELKIYPVEGTYLAWIDCSAAGIEGSPAEFFLKHGRVAFNDGKAFGKGGENFVRLNFACPQSTLLDGIARMKHALEVGRS